MVFLGRRLDGARPRPADGFDRLNRAARVLRTVGDNHEVRAFSTWCPMALAAIGKLPDTLEDRSLRINFQRKKKTDTARVRELRETRKARLASLREVVERREDVGAGTRHLLNRGDADRRTLGLGPRGAGPTNYRRAAPR